MKVIKQIFIILLFFVVGEIMAFVITKLFPSIFIPGPVLGLFVFLVVLLNKKIKVVELNDVEQVGGFLTTNMSFFFIPAAVAVMEHFDILKTVIFQVILIIIISLLLMFIAVVYTIKLTVYLQTKLQNKEAQHD